MQGGGNRSGSGAEDGVPARSSGRFREDEFWPGLTCAAVGSGWYPGWFLVPGALAAPCLGNAAQLGPAEQRWPRQHIQDVLWGNWELLRTSPLERESLNSSGVPWKLTVREHLWSREEMVYSAAENALCGFGNGAGLSECCFFLLLRRSCGVLRRYFGIIARNNLGSSLH